PNTQPSQQPINGNTTSAGATSVPTSTNPSFPPTSLQDPGLTKRPRDARLIHLILSNMGVTAYTERVPLQLLDFAYRYTSGILSDALAYEPPLHLPATSGKKKAANVNAGGGAGGDGGAGDEGVSLHALRTAIGARVAQQFNSTLPKEFMGEVAAERNRVALPRVEREFGVRLPPERYCFTGVGWGVKESWEEEVDEDEAMDLGAGVEAGGGGVGVGGPVGGSGGGEDTIMGGLEEEDAVDDEEFE
ncbi:TFIID-31kDa-domain-containing protein, partial [Lentithecium fluviatile CBS 122367]